MRQSKRLLFLSKPGKKYYCFNETCKLEIAFDQSMKAESGKLIPLQPGTRNPHKCVEQKKIETPPTPPKIPDNPPGYYEHQQVEGQELEYPKFNDKVIEAEVKRVSVWARHEANSINFPENFDKNSATHDELRARQIDRNVDKKDMMRYFFEVKYGKKKNSVDKLP